MSTNPLKIGAFAFLGGTCGYLAANKFLQSSDSKHKQPETNINTTYTQNITAVFTRTAVIPSTNSVQHVGNASTSNSNQKTKSDSNQKTKSDSNQNTKDSTQNQISKTLSHREIKIYATATGAAIGVALKVTPIQTTATLIFKALQFLTTSAFSTAYWLLTK